MDFKNLRFFQDHKKLRLKRQGPFKITEVLGPLTYRLQLPPQWKIHDVFHATLLTPYRATEAHGPNFAYPPPDSVEGEEQWEVEAITQHKKYGRKVKGKPQRYKFLVKWEGYPTSASSWEPEENLEGAQEILTKYKKLHKLRRIHIRRLHRIHIRTSLLAPIRPPTCPSPLTPSKTSSSSPPTPSKPLA